MLRRTVLLILIIACMLATKAWAQDAAGSREGRVAVPRLIRFSGALRPDGAKPAHGVVELSFSLFKDESGGDPLWFETQTVEVDALGRYNVLLGAMHPDGLPMDLFTSGEARWLSIMVGKVEQPRVLLVSVPYALKAADAESLGGKPVTSFVISEQLKEQVAAAMSDPKIAQRSLNTMVLATSGGGGTPPAIVETNPSTFTCTSASDCVMVTQSGTGRAVFATQTATSGTTYGVRAESASTSGTGVLGLATATTGSSFGVRGQAASTSGYGVQGLATATTGQTYGMWGQSASTSGRGIFGYSTATTGVTYGILGTAASTSGVGLMGQELSLTGATTGLRAEARSPDGIGAVIDNIGGGKLISGRTTGFVEKFSVAGSGNVVSAGTVTATSFIGSGASLTGVGDIFGITTAAGSGLSGGATSGTPSLTLLTSCGPNQVLKYVSSTWTCSDDNITVSPNALIRGINYLAGCDTCAVLADADDQQDFFVNVIGPLTVLSVACYTDGGTPSINVQRDDGSAANILTSNLTCTAGGASGTIDTNEDNIAVGEKLDFVLNTAGGAKRITLVIKATL